MNLTKFQRENLSKEEQEFLWNEMLKPRKITKKVAIKCIEEYERQIADFRARIKNIEYLPDKNMLYTRIENRETIIKKLNEYL